MCVQHFAKCLIVALFLAIVTVAFSATSVRNVNAQGQAPFLITPYFGTKGINSWFDHEYPTYYFVPNGNGNVGSENNIFTRYDGARWTNPPTPVDKNNCNTGVNCYDGHDGIDFALSYEHVIAAADGSVIFRGWANDNCRTCDYGLKVTIAHVNNNNYQTIYGHLSAIAVTLNQSVSAGQVIGTSGSTGNSGGAHLHFGVFNSSGRAVDPFGWSGAGTDPWQNYNGAISYCLWKDGEWADVCGRMHRPIPEPINGGETFTYVTTDNTGGFSKGENNGVMPPPFNNACTGNCANWTYYNNEMYWTLVNGSTPDSWAKWQAAVSPNGGMYEIFVYIPSSNATSWQASYTIRYLNNTLQTTALVDQYGLDNQWVSLDTYYMTNNDYVFTTDATGEGLGVHCSTGQYCRLGADTVKFVRRGTAYLPYLNTTDNWLSTVTIRNDGGGMAKTYLSLFDNTGLLRCSSSVDVASHAIQTFAVTATSCPPAKAAIVDASQDVVMVAREENNNGELNEYNGILASGGSLGWERVGSTVYVPLIKNARYGRSSKLHLMNAGQQFTYANVQFYNTDTGQPVGALVSYPLEVNASVRVPANECSGVINRCSARITSSANQPLAVAVLEQGDATTASRITYTDFSSGATKNFVPLLKKNRYGMTTGLVIHNTGSASTDVTVTCYDPYGVASVCGSQAGLPGKATAVLSSLNLPDNFVGSAVISSANQPIVTAIYESGSPLQMVTDAPLSGTNSAYAPELYGNYGMGGQTWNSGISVQNASASNATVTVTYYNLTGTQVSNAQTYTGLLPNQVWTLNYWNNNLPGNFAGSAVIMANQPVVAIVNVLHTGSGDTNASYTAPNR